MQGMIKSTIQGGDDKWPEKEKARNEKSREPTT